MSAESIIMWAAAAIAAIILLVFSALGVGEYNSPPDPPSVECVSSGVLGNPACETTTP